MNFTQSSTFTRSLLQVARHLLALKQLQQATSCIWKTQNWNNSAC